MVVRLDQVPDIASTAWTRLRDELKTILGQDLVALWAYGGTVFADRQEGLGDLDTFVVVKRVPDGPTIYELERTHDKIAKAVGIVWDIWYAVREEVRRSEPPSDALDPERREATWAICRAHWLADHYIDLYGPQPSEMVLVPSWAEIETAVSRELEHLERHVLEGDDNPFEATYAILNGSRILHAIDTGDVAISKRSAAKWALEQLHERWHSALQAADRTYGGMGTVQDAEVLRGAMAPFVYMVRERLPVVDPTRSGEPPRWSRE